MGMMRQTGSGSKSTPAKPRAPKDPSKAGSKRGSARGRQGGGRRSNTLRYGSERTLARLSPFTTAWKADKGAMAPPGMESGRMILAIRQPSNRIASIRATRNRLFVDVRATEDPGELHKVALFEADIIQRITRRQSAFLRGINAHLNFPRPEGAFGEGGVIYKPGRPFFAWDEIGLTYAADQITDAAMRRLGYR